MNCVEAFNHRQMLQLCDGKAKIPEFSAGDTLVVHVKIREGERERIQRFEGLCIARSNSGVASSFRVRRVTGGFGVERLFLLYSPLISHIECIRRGRVRRSKLFYVRELSRKKARIRERKSPVHVESPAV
jgi:large subunit ribosomal protein L19